MRTAPPGGPADIIVDGEMAVLLTLRVRARSWARRVMT